MILNPIDGLSNEPEKQVAPHSGMNPTHLWAGERIISTSTEIIEIEVVIAGSGPGGANMARELSKRGKKLVKKASRLQVCRFDRRARLERLIGV